jgi:hypothetical protein
MSQTRLIRRDSSSILLKIESRVTYVRYTLSCREFILFRSSKKGKNVYDESDGALREVVRKKILHYRQLYINLPDPIAFMSVTVDTSGRIYDDFSRLLYLHAHREASVLANENPEESGQFPFLRDASLVNIKGSVGLVLAKATDMRISIPLDLSNRNFIPLPHFIRSRCPTTLLTPSLVFPPMCSA